MKTIFFLPFLAVVFGSTLVVEHRNPDEFFQLFMYTFSNVSGVYWNTNKYLNTKDSIVYNVTKGDLIHTPALSSGNYSNSLIFPIEMFYNEGKPFIVNHEPDIKFQRLVWTSDGNKHAYPSS